MPCLTPEIRQSINARLAVHERIRSSYKDRQYMAMHCWLCNWASNGLTPEEAEEANRKHEAYRTRLLEVQGVSKRTTRGCWVLRVVL